MRKSDALVLIQNLDDISYETIPSKVYEYLQMNRPILALVYKNPLLKKMLLEQGHFVAEADSPAELGALIERIAELWLKDDPRWQSFPASPFMNSISVFAFFAEMGEKASYNFMHGARLTIDEPTVLTQVINLVDGLRLARS